MGSTPKFKAGDPVWVRHALSGREYAGLILNLLPDVCPAHAEFQYEVDIPAVPPPELEPPFISAWAVCEPYLRPRRDDYQQHEPLGSRADLDKPLLSIDVADLNLPEERVRQLEELVK